MVSWTNGQLFVKSVGQIVNFPGGGLFMPNLHVHKKTYWADTGGKMF